MGLSRDYQTTGHEIGWPCVDVKEIDSIHLPLQNLSGLKRKKKKVFDSWLYISSFWIKNEGVLASLKFYWITIRTDTADVNSHFWTQLMLKEERELSVKWEGTKVTLMGIAENIAVRNWS